MKQNYRPQPDEPTLVWEARAFQKREELLEQLAQAVARCQPPHVFGVHGDWGAGKTSFLHRLQLRLTGECGQSPDWEQIQKERQTSGVGETEKFDHVVAVWFEAWRYQSEPAPVVALLHEIRSQLTWKAHFFEKLEASLKTGAEVAFRAALLSLKDLTIKISAQVGVGFKTGGEITAKGPRLDEAWQATQHAHLAEALPSNEVRRHLNEILRKLLPDESLGKAKARLVVFIDDLDRCEPDTAFALLEGIMRHPFITETLCARNFS